MKFSIGNKQKTNLDKKQQNQQDSGGKQIGNTKWNPFLIILIALVSWSLLSLFGNPLATEDFREISINETVNLIKEGRTDTVTIDGKELTLELKDGETVVSSKESEISFYEILNMQDIDPNLVSGGIFEKQGIPWLDLFANLAIPVAMLVLFFWFFRQAGRSSGGLFSIGKSKAKLFAKDETNIGFKDVAGAHEIKQELVEVVDFLKHPEKYSKLGARIPRGILLVGPSGVGKTLLARAVAGEANVPFYSVAGSEFIEMIVGVGSARVRDLFAIAKASAPALIFIDEIDAIGRHRGKAMAMSNDEREQTLNQILVEMDGFDARTNVIIIAATNRPDMLDPALIRPGRFDRNIRIDFPDVKEREEIFKIHMKGKPFAKDVEITKLARQTVGFSGADIENMINEAAIMAARKSAEKVETKDLSEAATKVKLGPGRKLLQTEEEKKVVAYHEAGHALVACKNDNADPVSRISIVSRTMTLGHTEFLPRENINHTKSKLLAHIQSLLGGRAAEYLIFNEETIGAANDIERATVIAKKMVTDFGMSDLGPINFVSDNTGLWDQSAQDKAVGYSEKIAEKIDAEVNRIIRSEYENAKKMLDANRKVLDKLADALLEKETLEQDEFEAIINKYDQSPSADNNKE